MSTSQGRRADEARRSSRVGKRVSKRLREARDDLNVRLNAIVETVTGRNDILTTMVWDQPEGTPPGWFEPSKALITVNASVLAPGTHPDSVDPTTREGRLEQPVLVGVYCHESGHSRSPGWDQREIHERAASKLVARVCEMLLESWVDATQLEERPADEQWLRAALRHLLTFPPVENLSPQEEQVRAAAAAVLVLGRVEVGVLTAEDAADVESMTRNVLGDEALGDVRALLKETLALAEGDTEALIDVAQRLLTRLGIDPEDPEDAQAALPVLACHSGGQGGSGPDGSLNTNATDSGQPTTDPLATAVAAMADQVADDAGTQASRELASARAAALPDPKVLAAKTSEAKERAAARQAASVFGPSPRRSNGPITGYRSPTSQERVAAQTLARHLRRARHRGPDITVVPRTFPPGRLKTRAALQKAAQDAQNLPVTAQPFRHRRRATVEAPSLRVGLAVDVSGSMEATAAALASAMYVIGQAVQHVQGRSAALAWGTALTPLTRPGRAPTQVPKLATKEGTAVLPEAIRALDGVLGLAQPDHARLLVIASDGQLDSTVQTAEASGLIRRLAERGCPTLQLCLDGKTRLLPGAIEVIADDAAGAAHAIGQTAVNALRRTRS